MADYGSLITGGGGGSGSSSEGTDWGALISGAASRRRKPIVAPPSRSALGLMGNLLHDVKDAAFGIPMGVIELAKTAVTHPGDLDDMAKAALKGVIWTYEPGFRDGDWGEVANRAYQHPLGPVLDALTVATLGAGGVVKAAKITGDVGKVAKLTGSKVHKFETAAEAAEVADIFNVARPRGQRNQAWSYGRQVVTPQPRLLADKNVAAFEQLTSPLSRASQSNRTLGTKGVVDLGDYASNPIRRLQQKAYDAISEASGWSTRRVAHETRKLERNRARRRASTTGANAAAQLAKSTTLSPEQARALYNHAGLGTLEDVQGVAAGHVAQLERDLARIEDKTNTPERELRTVQSVVGKRSGDSANEHLFEATGQATARVAEANARAKELLDRTAGVDEYNRMLDELDQDGAMRSADNVEQVDVAQLMERAIAKNEDDGRYRPLLDAIRHDDETGTAQWSKRSDDLKDDIAERGMDSAIDIVVNKDGRLVVTDGVARLLAAYRAQRTAVPVRLTVSHGAAGRRKGHVRASATHEDFIPASEWGLTTHTSSQPASHYKTTLEAMDALAGKIDRLEQRADILRRASTAGADEFIKDASQIVRMRSDTHKPSVQIMRDTLKVQKNLAAKGLSLDELAPINALVEVLRPMVQQGTDVLINKTAKRAGRAGARSLAERATTSRRLRDERDLNTVTDYSMLGFRDVQDALRSEVGDVSDPELRAFVGDLDRAFEVAEPLKSDRVFYRGIPEGHAGDIVELGEHYEFGYTSTTTNRAVAKRFAGQGGDVVEVRVPAGTRVIDVDEFSKRDAHARGNEWHGDYTEQEFLLPRGAIFDLERVKPNGSPVIRYTGSDHAPSQPGPKAFTVPRTSTRNVNARGQRQSAAHRRNPERPPRPDSTRFNAGFNERFGLEAADPKNVIATFETLNRFEQSLATWQQVTDSMRPIPNIDGTGIPKGWVEVPQGQISRFLDDARQYLDEEAPVLYGDDIPALQQARDLILGSFAERISQGPMMVPAKLAERMRKEMSPQGKLPVIDSMTGLWRAAVVSPLRPAFVANNIVGQTALLAVAHGGLGTMRAVLHARQYAGELEAFNGAVIGSGQAATLMRETSRMLDNEGRLTGKARDINEALGRISQRLTDDPYRRIAFAAEVIPPARKILERNRNTMVPDGKGGQRPYAMKDALERLLSDERVLDRVERKVLDDLVDFDDLSHMERAFVRRIFPFWGWIKGSSKLTIKLAADNPVLAEFYARIGQYGTELTEEQAGGSLPDYMIGLLGLGDGGKDGKDKLAVTTAQFNPFVTPADALGQALFPLGLRPKGEQPFNPDNPLSQGSPLVKLITAGLFQKDPFTGRDTTLTEAAKNQFPQYQGYTRGGQPDGIYGKSYTNELLKYIGFPIRQDVDVTKARQYAENPYEYTEGSARVGKDGKRYFVGKDGRLYMEIQRD